AMLTAGLGVVAAAPSHAAPGATVWGHVVRLSPLTVFRSDGHTITVNLTPTTTVVRRFDGKSNPGELEINDYVEITGTSPSRGAMTAGAIQDFSIQVKYTEIRGQVLGIGGAYTSMTLRVTAHESGQPAFAVGEVVRVDITPSTPVRLPSGAMGSVQNLRPGMFVQLYGLSDQPNRVIVRP